MRSERRNFLKRRNHVYSPKIREDLIPQIYQAAKKAGVAMTAWVNQVVERALSESGKEEGPETRNGNFEKEEQRS